MIIKTRGDILQMQVLGKWRTMGQLKDRTLKIFRNQEGHLMKKYDAYGISEKLIKSTDLFDNVIIVESEKRGKINVYYLTKQDIIDHGIVAKEGEFENQIFIKRDYLNLNKVK